MRDEPLASIVQEALEGFASGRFDTHADVMRFLQDHPLFPKDSHGVRHFRVAQFLRQCVYAGYVEAPKWDISLRKGEHDGLIPFETFKRIQDKLNGKSYAPRRRNLNEDFPLRGYVICDCGTPLTACWTKGSHGRFPYYLCPKRGCENYGKSIRREKIESEFEALLQSVEPPENVVSVAQRMLRKWWDSLSANGERETKAMAAQLVKIERDVEKVLERMLDVTEARVLAHFEERVRKLEEEKIVIKERMAKMSRPASNFDDTLRAAVAFLANPWNLWRSGNLDNRHTVLKLVFASRLRYTRNNGFRTANLSLPFKVLGDFIGRENSMAHLDGVTSNQLFEVLADWNTQLEHLRPSKPPVPPCP